MVKMKVRVSFWLLLMILSLSGFISQCHGEATQDDVKPVFWLGYRTLQPGEVINVTLVSGSVVQAARASFSGQNYDMGPERDPKQKMTFIGLDLGMKPGDYPLEIKLHYKDGRTERIVKFLTIERKEFPVKKLWVDERFVIPPPEAMERIRRESALLNAVYVNYETQWLGEGSFIVPSEGEALPNFGERRVFNNKPRSQHSGVDISSPFGAPVVASNSGKVVLAGDLYYAGKTVIINHGLGVFTLYCHFSKIRVKRNEMVKKGDVIGEIGATGRATGPHLHWGVKVSGNRIDPLSLLDLELK